MTTYAVTGWRETQAAFRKADRDLAKLNTIGMAAAVEPVAVSARKKISEFRGAKVNRIRPAVTSRGVFVRQTQAKRGGKRPDFGLTQKHKLEEALEENALLVRANVALEVNRIVARAGFHGSNYGKAQ